METRLVTDNTRLCIFFDDHLHLMIDTARLNGLQSWADPSGDFVIEYYFSGGEKIRSNYTDREKWYKVLDLIHLKLP